MGTATNFQQKKESKKEHAVAAIGEALASQFELDFTLIACMASIVTGGVWYLDSSAMFHMMENRDIFSDFKEKDPKQNIEFGDDNRYNTTRISTVTFQRDSGSPLRIIDVM